MAQLNWIPNQGSFINALQAGAGAGFQSAALQAQAAARQQAMEQARRDQEFQVWRTQEMLRQQAEQNAIENQLKGRQLEAQAAQRMQDMNQEMERQKALQAHWNAIAENKTTPALKTFGSSQSGYWRLDENGNPIKLVDPTQKTEANRYDLMDYGAMLRELTAYRNKLIDPVFDEMATDEVKQAIKDRIAEIDQNLKSMKQPPEPVAGPQSAMLGAYLGMNPQEGTLPQSVESIVAASPDRIYQNEQDARSSGRKTGDVLMMLIDGKPRRVRLD